MPRLFLVFLLQLVCCLGYACSRQENSDMVPVIEHKGDSNVFAIIEKKWTAECEKVDALPKDQYGAETEVLHSLLLQLPEDQWKTFRSQLLKHVKDKGELSPFELSAVQATIMMDVTNGDRGNLIQLLSIYCPDRIGLNNYLEYYMLKNGSAKLAPIDFLLVDAYDGSSGENRARIERVLKRALSANIGSTSAQGAEFVRKCRDWLNQSANNRHLNDNYLIQLHRGKPPGTVPLYISN